MGEDKSQASINASSFHCIIKRKGKVSSLKVLPVGEFACCVNGGVVLRFPMKRYP